MAARRPRPEDRLLAELASWGGTFRPGLERQGVVRTEDGLEVEISIRVRLHTGAAQAAQLREEMLAWLRGSGSLASGYPNAFEAERCGCRLKGGRSCEGKRVVAVVVYRGFMDRDRNYYRFVCGRHRETHGVNPTDIVGVVELSERTLSEARDLVKRWNAAREAERKALILAHREGAHGLLPAGIVPAKKCPECDDLAFELSRCRSSSPTTGRRCHEDQGHGGPHRQRFEEWAS